MKKNSFKFFFLASVLFISNPGLILAEELIQDESNLEPVAEIVTVPEETQIQEIQVEQIEESTPIESMPITDDVATTSEEISQNFLSPSLFSEDFNSATNTITVNLNVRYQDSLIFSGPITLVEDATTTVIDNTNTNREIISSTAFGALVQADSESSNFNISNLAYYPAWQAFLINCLDVSTSTNSSAINACYNWQYVVNDSYPFVGSDQYDLSNGDNVYFYFGAPKIVELATSTIEVGQTIIAIAKSYDYQNNLYVPLPNSTIGMTQPDPNNPWSPTVISATTSDEMGQGFFTASQIGSYGFGLADDYYSLLTNLTVVATSSNASTTSATSTDSGSGGNSSSDSLIDINKAIDFLAGQTTNGSYGNDLYTDWVAIGVAAHGNSALKSLIKSYLASRNFSADSLTDYERHAMALMSLGINPYSGTKINYIEKIIKEFDGEQFGDEGLVNDDIFALFPLLNAGYESSDVEISKSVAYIISRQNSNGSFESLDLTAAAIQALSLVTDLPNVNSTLSKAKNYLNISQQNNGSFGNTFSTLWATQVTGDDVSLKYLASRQNQDGGLEFGSSLDNRVWATAYLIPAYYGKSWDDLMINFKKPKTETDETNNSSSDEENVSDSVSDLDPVSEDEEAILENPEGEEINNQLSTIESDLPILKNSQPETEQLSQENTSPDEQNNLQANVLGGASDSGLLEIMGSFIDTTLAGLSTMLGFIVSLFNF